MSTLLVAWRICRRLLEAAFLLESGQRRSITRFRWRQCSGARASSLTRLTAFLSRQRSSPIVLEATETRKPPSNHTRTTSGALLSRDSIVVMRTLSLGGVGGDEPSLCCPGRDLCS